MSEYEVQITLKAVTVSADTPAEAVTRASQQVTGDLSGNTSGITATKVERIQVPGFRRD